MTSPDPSATVLRRRLLGVGIRADLVDSADLARDVVLRRSATGVDLDLVEAVAALSQDLSLALTTLRGSDPFNVRFGFIGLSALADHSSPVLAREAVRSAVAQLLAADPRVRRITDVTVTTPSPGSRALSIAVSFEAVSGDPADLSSAAAQEAS